MVAVALDSVSKRFGVTAAALESISLEIESGEFITLLGPSGCGKTTTLRLIAGLSQPDSGRILIRGRDVTPIPVHRRNIGMVFQSHALFPHLTIAENIAFGLKMRGVGRSEQDRSVRQALALVRLQKYGDRLPNELSGGQQQRVALARALVFGPDVLLLDEPFGALDRKLRETMQIELRELSRKVGVTSIFVTHDQEEALMLSDRIVVMNAGHIEQVGRPDHIFEHPKTRFVADFMGFSNILEGSVSSLDPNGTLIQVDRLRIQGPPSSDLKAGQRIAIAFRPERVRIDAADEPSDEPGFGTIEARSYQGVTCTYQIRPDHADGYLVAARESAPGNGEFRFDIGARVKAEFLAGAIRLLAI